MTDGLWRARVAYLAGPTLFDRVTTEMRLDRGELCGLMPCLRHTPSLAAATARVNSQEHAWRSSRAGGVALQIAAGRVEFNVPVPPMAFHNFGSWRRSLSGNTAISGPDGVHCDTRSNTVTARWQSALTQAWVSGLPP